MARPPLPSLVEVRAADLTRVGVLDAYSTGQLIPRFCGVGSWRLTVPGSGLAGDQLEALLTGGGIIVTHPDGQVLGSGPLTRRILKRDDTTGPDGQWDLQGATDELALQDRDILPDPTSAPDSQTLVESDDRSGPAETRLVGYVNANAGPGALLARRSLLVETDLARGSSGASSYRFANLLDAAVEVALGGGVGFRVVQLGTSLTFQVFEPADLSGAVRLSFEAGTLRSLTHTEEAPDLTRVVVAGGGEGTARVFREVASTLAEATWARRIERTQDRRDTSDTAVLDQAGADTLAAGAAKAGISITPVDTAQTRFGRDYNLGDIVSAGPLVDVVREVVITLGSPDQYAPVVGDPAATTTPDLYTRLRRLEANAARSNTAD